MGSEEMEEKGTRRMMGNTHTCEQQCGHLTQPWVLRAFSRAPGPVSTCKTGLLSVIWD